MVFASCSFWTQAYTCFDSSQSWHVLRKRKRKGGSWSSLLACYGDTAIDRLECRQSSTHFQPWWKMARKDIRDMGCPAHSRAITPHGESLAPVCQGASLLALYVGALFFFSLDCHSCLSPHPSCDLFVILPSFCVCLHAPLHLPALMH